MKKNKSENFIQFHALRRKMIPQILYTAQSKFLIC